MKEIADTDGAGSRGEVPKRQSESNSVGFCDLGEEEEMLGPVSNHVVFLVNCGGMTRGCCNRPSGTGRNPGT